MIQNTKLKWKDIMAHMLSLPTEDERYVFYWQINRYCWGAEDIAILDGIMDEVNKQMGVTEDKGEDKGEVGP
jgi:hypothetical protein